MAKNIRISDTLYALAFSEAALQHRSLAQQVEYWAKLGMAAEHRCAKDRLVGALEAHVEATRRLDIRDVLQGQRSAEYTFFIPRALASASEPVFKDEDP